MKGFSGHAKFAVLLALLLLIFHTISSTCGTTTRNSKTSSKTSSPRRHQRMVCTKENRSFWLRNSCFDGFVTVHNKRVIAQHEGIDQHSPEVEVVKETCKDHTSGLLDPFMVRLFHPKSHSYICFNHRGRVKRMSKQRAERLGKLCAFYETPAADTNDGQSPSLYAHLQSAYNRDWLLGFNGRPKRITHTGSGNAATLPRPMLDQADQNRQRHFRPEKCDFLFATGEYSAVNVRNEWQGLFDAIRHRGELDAVENSVDESSVAFPESVTEKGLKNEDTFLQNVNFEKAKELLHAVEESFVPEVTSSLSPSSSSSELSHPLVSPTVQPRNAIKDKSSVMEKKQFKKKKYV